MYQSRFLRTLTVGTKFFGQDHVQYTVVAPGTFIVRCRDSQFNLVWELDGAAIVKVRVPDPKKQKTGHTGSR